MFYNSNPIEYQNVYVFEINEIQLYMPVISYTNVKEVKLHKKLNQNPVLPIEFKPNEILALTNLKNNVCNTLNIDAKNSLKSQT